MADDSIAVIQTVYRRPQHFQSQLQAIRAQTVKPKEHGIWANHAPDVDLRPILNSGIPHVVSHNYNWGVWPRFLFGMEFSSEFICVFDDDTLPGPRWLENCLSTMKKVDGLLGTVGVVFPKGARNPSERRGWMKPNESILRADIVGHSWFFRRDWLRYYAAEPRLGYSTCGEDYHFSVTMQKQLGKRTYIPPHPQNKRGLWGNTSGHKRGSDKAALWLMPGEKEKKLATHDAYRASGWKTLFDLGEKQIDV